MSELKPCPFCGGREFLVIPPSCKESDPYNPADLAVPLVRCRTAGCWAEVPGKTWDHSKKSAIEAWNRRTPSLPASAEGGEASYQQRVHNWMMTCFNDEIAFSVQERNHRFLEEALELVQAQGCTKSEAYQLVDYVFDRPVGEPLQEVGGVIVCLAALCTASKLDMREAGETELARIWTKVEKIRAKHAAKPQFSPLPGRAALKAETSR